jgi:phage tail-like protein
MNKQDPNSFLYLNRDNRWLDFNLSGLDLREDGALSLATLPRFEDRMREFVQEDAQPYVAGVAVSGSGAIWFTDPKRHLLMRIGACDGNDAPAQPIGGEGDAPGRLREPRGVAIHPSRNAVMVADSGNNRIQIFSAESLRLQAVWDDSGAGPFNAPQSLAVDARGDVYVVDYGNRRVLKFDLRGDPIPEFWQTVQSELAARQKSLPAPSEIALNPRDQATEVFILDGASGSIFVFDKDGHFLSSMGTSLEAPIGLAVNDEAIFVGDAKRNRIFKFKRDGALVGEAQDFHGAVNALALDSQGGLFVHTGGEPALIRLNIAGAYVKRGWMVGGPFHNPSPRREQWHRLKAMIAPLPSEAHLRIFVYSSDDDLPPPGDGNSPPWEGNSVDLAESLDQLLGGQPLKRWLSLPTDIAESLFPGAPLGRLWVGVEFTSEGLTTPLLSQARVDFDHETYIRNLPSIYREDTQSAAFLTRFLALFESLFIEVETKINSLPELFDPQATPSDFAQWLAGWLALELDGEWSEERKREAIARAFDLYARRGTVEGLRESLRFFAGIEARIEEPLQQAGWWALPADEDAPEGQRQASLLGFTTTLVASEAQGAVVGATATLDQSHLITQEEFGATLFDDLAHRFSVHLYQGGAFRPDTIETLRAVLDREKPAHTDYHLCVIEPKLRIGFQSRVGIDTIIAGPCETASPGLANSSEAGFVLGGEPAGRIGQRSSVGKTTRLGLRPFEAQDS